MARRVWDGFVYQDRNNEGQVVTGSVSEDFRLLEIKHNPLSRSIDPRFSTANIGGGTRVKR